MTAEVSAMMAKAGESMGKPMQLRPYQWEAIDALVQFYHRPGIQSGLCVLPTASGKTVIFAAAIGQLLGDYPELRILVLAHTREIVLQNAQAIKSHCPEVGVGVYCKSLKRVEVAQVTSASRDSMVTLVRDEPCWDLVVVDEAHLIPPAESSRYQQILAQIYLHQDQYKLWGFTATPFRMGHGLIYELHSSPPSRSGQSRHVAFNTVFKMDSQRPLFERLIFQKRLGEMVQIGYLCPVRAVKVNPQAVANTTTVKHTRQDFEASSLLQVTDSALLVQHIVQDWQQKTAGRLATVFYAASVQQGLLFSECLADGGIAAPLIHAKTDPLDRQQWLDQFASGELTALVNVNTLTTGWDCPRLACIVMARPTLSAGLFMQIVGRGLRLYRGKTETLLLDYGDNLARFGMLERLRPLLDGDPAALQAQQNAQKIQACSCCETLCSIYDLECSHCGESLNEEDDVAICPYCVSGNDPFADWCDVCGEQFDTV